MDKEKKYILIDIEKIGTLSTINKNAYAFFISLQLKYNNNKIYNYSLSHVAKLTGISITSAHKYINILNRWGLITINSKILYLKKEQKEKNKKLYKYHLYRSLNKKNTLLLLYTLLIEQEKNKQLYAINLKQLFKSEKYQKFIKKNYKTINVKKMYNKYKKYNYSHGRFNTDVRINSRLVAKKLNISNKHANNILNKAANNNLIFLSKKYKFICNVDNLKSFLQFKKTINKNFDDYIKLVYSNHKVYRLVGYNYKHKLVNSIY